MINNALIPRRSACRTNFSVMARSELTYLCLGGWVCARVYEEKGTYSWRNCTWPGAAASTISSNEQEASVGILMRIHGLVHILKKFALYANHLDDSVLRSCPGEV